MVVAETANLNEWSLEGNNGPHLFACLIMINGDIIPFPAVTADIWEGKVLAYRP